MVSACQKAAMPLSASLRLRINPQKPAFGCKQLSGCIHGAPPHTPPKGTFCKKSPWESRKTAFDFYCLVFHRLLSRYQKTGVHSAYSPSASLSAVQHLARLTRKSQPSVAGSYQAVFMGLRPIPRPRGLFVKSPLGNPEKQRLTFIVWFFTGCSQGIKRPAYIPPTRLRRRNALVQRDASLTRKTWPSAASSYQDMFALKVSKITVHAADF